MMVNLVLNILLKNVNKQGIIEITILWMLFNTKLSNQLKKSTLFYYMTFALMSYVLQIFKYLFTFLHVNVQCNIQNQ